MGRWVKAGRNGAVMYELLLISIGFFIGVTVMMAVTPPSAYKDDDDENGGVLTLGELFHMGVLKIKSESV